MNHQPDPDKYDKFHEDLTLRCHWNDGNWFGISIPNGLTLEVGQDAHGFSWGFGTK